MYSRKVVTDKLFIELNVYPLPVKSEQVQLWGASFKVSFSVFTYGSNRKIPGYCFLTFGQALAWGLRELRDDGLEGDWFGTKEAECFFNKNSFNFTLWQVLNI